MKLNAEGLNVEISAVCRVDAEDWTRVWVSLAVHGFKGGFEAWLQLEDLRRFSREVSQLYANPAQAATARLCSAEPDIDIQIHMNNRGQIRGTYSLESERREGVPTQLLGAFVMDQSYLPALEQSVHALITYLCRQ